jgi:hypothetical protein
VLAWRTGGLLRDVQDVLFVPGRTRQEVLQLVRPAIVQQL